MALQSVPPGEPCELAHTLIRMVRFNKFLSQVPSLYCVLYFNLN